MGTDDRLQRLEWGSIPRSSTFESCRDSDLVNNYMTYYIIYQITNKINGKTYIGAHKTSDINDTYMGSGSYLKLSQQKHGISHFTKDILFNFSTSIEMYKKERELVNEEYVASKDTYNLTLGGYGGFSHVSDESMAERNRQISKRRDYSCSLFINNLKESMRKINHDVATAKRHATMLEKFGALTVIHFEGKHHTEESKLKIGKKNSKHQQGKGNSQFGTKWIHSLKEKRSMKIKKYDNVPDNWILGRKMKF